MIYQYQGHSFSAQDLTYLAPSFSQSYQQSISKNLSKDFLFLIDRQGKENKKTFAQFAADVEGARLEIVELPPEVVVVCIDDNSYEFLVYAIAAVLEGHSFCPMSPLEGEHRLRAKLATLTLQKKIFVGRNYQTLITDQDFKVMAVSSQRPLISGEEIKPSVAFPLGKPFIYIFTSGTTGNSKIVMQKEEGILSNVDALIQRHRLDLETSVATCLPVYHVNALEFSFFCTLLSGNKLYLMAQFDLQQITSLLQQYTIHIVSLVPTLIHALSQAQRLLPQQLFSKTRYIVTAAAPLSRSVGEEFYRLFSCRILQGYGLSEAVNFSLLNPPAMSEELYRWSLTSEVVPSVGTPIAGNEVFILGADGEILKEGLPGEIALRGFNIMQGYFGEDPGLTFKDDYLRTGDYGFYKNSFDGQSFYFITGRLKEIIKRHGVTLSLSEVERDIVAFPNRNFEAIAVGFANDFAGEEVAVIINMNSKEGFAKDALWSYLRECYPNHLRPRLFIISKTPVRGPSGKSRRGDFTEILRRYKKNIYTDREVLVVENDGT